MAGASEMSRSLTNRQTCIARLPTPSFRPPLSIAPVSLTENPNTACHTSCQGICSVPASSGVRPTVNSFSLAATRAEARASRPQPATASARSSAYKSANQRWASAGLNAWSSASICAAGNCRANRTICTSRSPLAHNKRRTASTSPDSTLASSASNEAPAASGLAFRCSVPCPPDAGACKDASRPSCASAVAVAACAGNRPSLKN